jgi:hypothetical protein
MELGRSSWPCTPAFTVILIFLLRCEANAFGNTQEVPGHLQVLKAVEDYFTSEVIDNTSRVSLTSLPPLYFQYPGTDFIWAFGI